MSYNINIEHTGNRQEGIPKYAYWAAMIDPRTKRRTMRLLANEELDLIWRDIDQEILAIISSNEATTATTNEQSVLYTAEKQKKKNAKKRQRFFLQSPPKQQKQNEDNSNEDDNEIRLKLRQEITSFKQHDGIDLQNEDGEWNCPLKWWQQYENIFPNIWLLGQRILSIPATSAPAERVFSGASNVISKKRANLTPDTAETLMFLRGNTKYVKWDI